MTGRIRVATVITRMTAGAGGVALRGALALDPDAYEVTMVTGGAGLTARTAIGRRGRPARSRCDSARPGRRPARGGGRRRAQFFGYRVWYRRSRPAGIPLRCEL